MWLLTKWIIKNKYLFLFWTIWQSKLNSGKCWEVTGKSRTPEPNIKPKRNPWRGTRWLGLDCGFGRETGNHPQGRNPSVCSFCDPTLPWAAQCLPYCPCGTRSVNLSPMPAASVGGDGAAPRQHRRVAERKWRRASAGLPASPRQCPLPQISYVTLHDPACTEGQLYLHGTIMNTLIVSLQINPKNLCHLAVSFFLGCLLDFICGGKCVSGGMLAIHL